MKYEYTHFIPENVAPKGATRIVFKSGNKEVCSIPAARFGDLTPPEGEPLYSFGLISDVHLCPGLLGNDGTRIGNMISQRFDNALTWFEEQGASFVACCGDFTNVGFENPKGTYNDEQFEEYKRIRLKHPNLPMYTVAGNHESYNAAIRDYVAKYKAYTDPEVYDPSDTVTYDNNDPKYTKTLGVNYAKTVLHDGVEDLYIFLSMVTAGVLYNNGATVPIDEFSWMEELIAANQARGGRCFVFMHPFIAGDSGDITGRSEPIKLLFLPSHQYVINWFKRVLPNHGRAVLFHGHSHFMQTMQEKNKMTNYASVNGFHSVHVPALGSAATLGDNNAYIKDWNNGCGYLVDVYPDCIYLRGRDFVRNEWVGIGTYRIEVTA